MSETKHTPLPWRHGDAYHDPGRGENIFIGSDGVVVATTGDIGGFFKEANADLVLTSVNAHERLEADSKKLREPATCNAGHGIGNWHQKAASISFINSTSNRLL